MRDITEYEINYDRYRLKFLNIGAAITEYCIDNTNVVLAYEDLESYRMNDMCLGVIVGRSAGRIRYGKIPNGQLPLNENGKHNLHGNNLHHAFYDVVVDGNKAILTLYDDEGPFPGNAKIEVIYELTGDGLKQTILASSDKPTIFNMTNHSYFNLGNETILNHELQIYASRFFTLDEESLPKALMNVKDTLFDFNKLKTIKNAQNLFHPQLLITDFLNHPYQLDGSIILKSDKLQLEVVTDREFAVIYTGNHLDQCTKKIQKKRNYCYSGICIETQSAPGTTEMVEEFNSTTCYKLSKC